MITPLNCFALFLAGGTHSVASTALPEIALCEDGDASTCDVESKATQGESLLQSKFHKDAEHRLHQTLLVEVGTSDVQTMDSSEEEEDGESDSSVMQTAEMQTDGS